MTAFLEISAHLIWPEIRPVGCGTSRGKNSPNCETVGKAAEGTSVRYAFNECGYRSRASCGPVPERGLRVAVLGSSIAGGYWVAYDQSFAGRSEATLTGLCGRPVDFQNLSSVGLQDAEDTSVPPWLRIPEQAAEALTLKPAAIVLIVTQRDLNGIPLEQNGSSAAKVPSQLNPLDRARYFIRTDILSRSRAALIAQHFAYLNPDRYIDLFLLHGDEADFLRPPFTPSWRRRLEVSREAFRQITAMTKPAGVPFIVVYFPPQPEAALAHATTLPQGVDPFAFAEELGQVAKAEGADFVDATEAFRHTDPAGMYFPADGHPTGQGHTILANAVDEALEKTVPAFAACRPAKPATTSLEIHG